MNRRFQTIRKVIITGPMEQRNEALSWAYANGYTTHYSGPMPKANYQADVTRFKIVAEKRIA